MSLMVQGNGITKRTELLIEPVKRHSPEEMAEIGYIHREEYLKKQAVIRDRMEKLWPKVEEVEEMEDVAAGMDFFRTRLFSSAKKLFLHWKELFEEMK